MSADGSMRRLKVLLSAYACEPGMTSEPGVGWNWALQMARYHDVWVLTRQTNREVIEKELSKMQVEGLHFVYYDLPYWLRFWKKKERGLYLYYSLWQLGTLFVALRLYREIRFDLAHYITMGSVMVPTFFSFLRTRIILGPIGGGGRVPLKFLREFSLKGKINEIIRHIVQFLYRFNPLLLLIFRKADKILLRDKETLEMVPEKLRKKCFFFCETGVPAQLLHYHTDKKHKNGLTIVTVGRFLHWKISVLTLKILQRFKEKYGKPFRVFIVGDGNEKKNLIHYCQKNNIKENIIFTGQVQREKVFEILSESDIYISTSFKEGGSWALFEAITMELPVISLKAGGSDLLICDGCGIKINIKNPAKVIEDFSDALVKLAENPSIRLEMAKKAKSHLLKYYTWEELGRRMNRIYEEVVS